MAACWSDQARVFLDIPTDGAGDALTDSAHGRSLSHRALRDAAASAAERLAGERSLVFLFCRNDAPTVITYLACAQAGHAVALLDSAMSPEQRRALLALYRPEWLAGADPIGDEAWREAGAGLTHMWRRSSGHGGELHPDLFLLLSTSGSTGSPKLVRLTQGAVEANAVGHDAQVGDCSVFSPYAVVNGAVVLGEEVFLGTHATVTPGLTVGRSVKIAAGAVVRRPVPAHALAVGNPARSRVLYAPKT